MSNIPNLLVRALDHNGDPISGAKMYFYETGTTTPYDTYSDRDRTNANANPVVADSNGLFGEIYMDPDQEYRVKYTNSDDSVVYWTLDEVYCSNEADAATNTRTKQAASNPLDYRSALGDGAADEYLAVQDAIDNSTGTVDLLGKTFRCDSQLTGKAGMTLKNGTLDFSSCSDTELLKLVGTGLSATDNIINTGAAGGNTVNLSNVTGLSVGDLVYLNSITTNWESTDKIGEIAKITGIGGTNLTIADPLVCTYATDVCKKITTVDKIRIENVKFISPSGSVNIKTIEAKFCDDLKIKDCVFEGSELSAVDITACYNFTVDNCSFEQSQGTKYYIRITDSSANGRIKNCSMSAIEEGIVLEDPSAAGAGVGKNITISDCSITNASGKGIEVDDCFIFTTIKDCYITGDGNASTFGIRCKSAESKIIDNRIENTDYGIIVNATPSAAFASHTIPGNYVISRNIIKNALTQEIDFNCSTGDMDTISVQINDNICDDSENSETHVAIDVNTTGDTVKALHVQNNTLFDGTIKLAATGTVEDIVVTGNNLSVHSATTTDLHGILVSGDGAIKNVVVTSNIIEAAYNSVDATAGIYVDGDNVLISDNIVSNNVDGSEVIRYGVYIGNQPTYAQVSNNKFEGVSISGVYLNGSSTSIIHINDNIMIGSSGTAGIQYADVKETKICDNKISGFTDGMLFTNNAAEATYRVDYTINNNKVDFTGSGMDITLPLHGSRLQIASNMLIGASATDGIEINTAAVNDDFISIINNDIYATGTALTRAIEVLGGDAVNISNNSIHGDIYCVWSNPQYVNANNNNITDGQIIIGGDISSNYTVNNNIFGGFTSAINLVSVDTAARVTISGNANGSSTAKGFLIDDVAYFSITGNNVLVGDYSTVEIVTSETALTTGSISGNSLVSSGDTNPNIELAGDAAGEVDGVMVGGNMLKNGSTGVNCTNTDNVNVDGNVVLSTTGSSVQVGATAATDNVT